MSKYHAARATRCRRHSSLAGLFSLFALAQSIAAPPAAEVNAPSPPSVPAISTSLQLFVDRGDLAGAVALVGQRGKLVHLDAVGYADVESQRPMRFDTLFSIMSMTKPVAAVAALIC